MNLSKFFLIAPLASALAFAQGPGVNPDDLLKPLKDSWPTYNGDYSGKRFSALTQIDKTNVQHLTLAWTMPFTGGTGSGPGRRRAEGKLITGGEGPADLNMRSGSIKCSVLEVNGTLYFTMPDNAWAVDAHDGRTLWHYFWHTKGGTHIGNRGLAMWKDYLYMETPDDYLVSLEAKTGKERWHKALAEVEQGYFSTPAPIIAGNHVLVGTGNDIDSAGFLKSYDPETGELQWRFHTVPQKKGDPGSESWPNADMSSHGGGMTWVPITYDPDLKKIYVTTGNPQPAAITSSRTPSPVWLSWLPVSP